MTKILSSLFLSLVASTAWATKCPFEALVEQMQTAATNRTDPDAAWQNLLGRAAGPMSVENNEKLAIALLAAPPPSPKNARATAEALFNLRRGNFSREVKAAMALRIVMALDSPVAEPGVQYPYSYLGEALDAFDSKSGASETSNIVAFRLGFARKLAKWSDSQKDIQMEMGARVSISTSDPHIDPIYSEMVATHIDDSSSRQHLSAIEWMLMRVEFYGELPPDDAWRPKQLVHYGSSMSALRRYLAKPNRDPNLDKQIRDTFKKAGLPLDGEFEEIR